MSILTLWAGFRAEKWKTSLSGGAFMPLFLFNLKKDAMLVVRVELMVML